MEVVQDRQYVTYGGKQVQTRGAYSSETLHAREKWQSIFQLLKEKNYQPQILNVTKSGMKGKGKLSGGRNTKRIASKH